MIRVAIADDESLFRKGVAAILEEYDDLTVVAQAKNGEELLQKVAELDRLPDVILLDLRMPVMNGVDCTRQLQSLYPDIRIVILTTHYTRAFILRMIEMGAASYLPKNSEPEEVILTIREVVSKGFYYNHHVMMVIRENMLKKESKPKIRSIALTKRELEVLQLICEQYTTAEIADRLYLSPRTVDGHRNNLLEKTSAKNTAGLVVYALENGIIKLKENWL